MVIEPVPLTPLIGRAAECAFLRDALTRKPVRLVTLTGLAGVGKTHLAAVVTAALVTEFAGNTYFIPLGHLRDPELVLAAVSRAVGLPRNHGGPDMSDLVYAKLASAATLFTFDNLDRVAGVGPDLLRLLEACPGVRILATSRTPLRLPGEVVMPLRPLRVPDLSRQPTVAELGANEAVSLLVQRVQTADPTFALTEANAAEIAGICVQLDGLPLAIELAAARLQVLSPGALKERLSSALTVLTHGSPGLPPRHQSLRAAIASSDALLSPLARTLFHRLAVFAGSCDAAAAEAICGVRSGDGVPSCQVLDALAELLEHGLIHREVAADEPRFIMPETICEYALELLETAGHAERMQHRHAVYFLTLAEEAAPALTGADQDSWLTRLEAEHDNLRAALRWSLPHNPDVALRLAASLWRFWYARGPLREGQRWMERALATSVREQSVHRVRALNGLGVLVWTTGNRERALQLQNASLSLAQELGDAWGAAVAQADRALVEFTMGGDAGHARAVTEEILAQFRALGDRHLEGIALTTLGTIAYSQGDAIEADQRFADALVIARESQDHASQALCLFNLGQTARHEGDLDRAAAYHLEAIALAHRAGGREEILYNLAGIAGLAVARGQPEHATHLLGAADALAEAIGALLQPVEQAQFDRDLEATRSALSPTAFAKAWAAGRAMTMDMAVAEAVACSGPPRRGTAAHGLSQREVEVLRLLANGLSDREIADALYISSDTAITHVKHIRRKLGVQSRGAAVAYATRHDFI